jgi:hypothetical protein
MTEVARRERLINPMTVNQDTSDNRFRTLFQQDFYETAILSKKNLIIVSQYIDWEAMASFNDDIFTHIAEACEVKGLKNILGYQHDWNTKVIAQFFTIVYFDERAEDRRQWVLRWMIEGDHYSITYERFAELLGFLEDDLDRHRIHSESPLPLAQTQFMYPPNHRGKLGKVSGLYTYYSTLNIMFRKTIYLRVGDNKTVVSYMKNLLARMQEGATRFSVFAFIWDEIKDMSCSPLKSYALAPYIMGMIEVTCMTFEKDGKHLALQLVPAKDPIVPQVEPLVGGPAEASAPTAAGTLARTVGTSTLAGTMGATTSQSQSQFVWGSLEYSYARERDSSL